MTLQFLRPALEDVTEVRDYYDSRRFGLGNEFNAEVEAAVERITEAPRAWQLLDVDIRRYLIHRFPYALIYSIHETEIVILAVVHLHRDAKAWRDRI